MCDFPTTCHEINQVVDGSQRANIGAGILERGAIHIDVQSFRYPGRLLHPYVQRMADHLTFGELKRVPAALHHCFHEYGELFGGRLVYPFAHPRILRLGIDMPYYLKRRRGKNKWLWRKIAAPYIGKEAAFRRKYAFPTLTERLAQPRGVLLHKGISQ